MKAFALTFVAAVLIIGCADHQDTANGPSPVVTKAQPTPPVTPAVATDQQKKEAAAAEQSLRSMGAPIYPGAIVDNAQHASSDPQASNAVFTTPATIKQVEYFYDSVAELKKQAADGSTVFTGTLNNVPLVIEIRPNKGGTEITVQGRKA